MTYYGVAYVLGQNEDHTLIPSLPFSSHSPLTSVGASGCMQALTSVPLANPHKPFPTRKLEIVNIQGWQFLFYQSDSNPSLYCDRGEKEYILPSHKSVDFFKSFNDDRNSSLPKLVLQIFLIFASIVGSQATLGPRLRFPDGQSFASTPLIEFTPSYNTSMINPFLGQKQLSCSTKTPLALQNLGVNFEVLCIKC